MPKHFDPDWDKKVNEESAYIFNHIRNKYPADSILDIDMCLNALCFALLRLRDTSVNQKNHEEFADLVKEILSINIKN